MTRNRASAKKAGACPKCHRETFLASRGSEMCRACAASIASQQAARANETTTDSKFERYVDRRSGCWIWAGHRYSNGYGAISHERKQVLAHRWSYERFVGPIPAGLVIDHLCRNKSCVNPEHLEPVTSRENSRRAMRSHCVNGHEFTTDNTWMYRGKRYCRECRRRRVREFQQRGKAA